VFSDSNPSPTTAVAYMDADDGGSLATSIPILPNMYYKVANTGLFP